MKKFLLSAALLALTGCCDQSPAPNPNAIGQYSTKTVTVVRKYDLSGDHYHSKHVDLRIDGKVYPFSIPSSLEGDEMWWANLVERETYKALLEEKQDGRYIWSYEAPPR